MFKLTKRAYTGIMAGGALILCSNPAQAFSFKTNFTATNGSVGDIKLNSVEFDGATISDFVFVEAVIPELMRGVSTDRGDRAMGLAKENPTAQEIAVTLGNAYLSQIIDTEDNKQFKFDLFFEKDVQSLFFWERGMNSKLAITAIDRQGQLLSNSLVLDFEEADYAGYKLNTTEISSAQKVGSIGVKLSDFQFLNAPASAIAGIKVAANKEYNGPDFKVVGFSPVSEEAPRAEVPEPSTILGLGLIAGAIGAARRRSKTA